MSVAPPASNQGTPTGRLIAWLVLVGVLAAVAFAGNALVDHTSVRQAEEQRAFYSYASAIAGIVFYAIILGVVLLIARGLDRRAVFALYRPTCWPRTLGLVLGVLFATDVAIVAVSAVLGPGGQTDQGIPTYWDGAHAAQFMLNLAVVAVVAPVVEELMFRGLGFNLLSSFGGRHAMIDTAILFGLFHGFLAALPVFVVAGYALAWLRNRTGSVYPGMVMHGTFNTMAVVLAITGS